LPPDTLIFHGFLVYIFTPPHFHYQPPLASQITLMNSDNSQPPLLPPLLPLIFYARLFSLVSADCHYAIEDSEHYAAIIFFDVIRCFFIIILIAFFRIFIFSPLRHCHFIFS